MPDPKNHQNLDPLLDSLLASYSDAEPRPGLETRIVANLRAQAAERSSPWWHRPLVWISAGAAAVIATAILAFMSRAALTDVGPKPDLQSKAPSVQTPAPAPVMKADVPPIPANGSQLALRHQTRKPPVIAADNRPAVFPTPAPLSEQEKLLFRYLAGTPREEIIAQSRPEPETELSAPADDQSSLPVGQPGTPSTSQTSNTK
ncbi:MAG TPA: hypothetical protein VEW69_09650 [Alphaproteobacteria bacterium]|nr:hypothetical protein [Alphaproteobacteria bacterium]